MRGVAGPGLRIVVILCLAGWFQARADGTVESVVPEGFDPASKIGRIHLYLSKSSPPSSKTKNELVARLTAVRDTLGKTYGLGVDRERLGVGTGMFQDRTKDPIDVIVFPAAADQRAWESTLGTKAVRPHLVAYSRTVPLALEGDLLPDEEWMKACHELAHVYLDLTVYTGLPRWLEEGFATHIAYTNKHAPCMNQPSFMDRIKVLGERRDRKSFVPLADVLQEAQASDSSVGDDQAWILVDLLVREGVWGSLIGRLQQLDCAAMQNPVGVADDMKRDAARFVGESCGGTSKLQSAWEAHLGNVLSSPEKPKRLGTSLKAAPNAPVCSIEGLKQDKRIVRTLDKDAIVRRFGGEIKYSGPGAGRVRITIRFGDGKGRWSRTYLYEDWGQMAVGASTGLGREEVETDRDEKVAEIGVEIETEHGGFYRVAKTLALK